jgi:hypothetical protein
MTGLFTSRRGLIGGLCAVGGLLGMAVWLQMVRDRTFATDRPVAQIMYIQSPEVMKRMTLGHAGIAADLYWIRALQVFGGQRRSESREKDYGLLFPLLNLSTSLDPHFNIAYRFGAMFLSEPPPGGPGRPDQAIALLQKGISVSPDRWQYYQDLGFVHYWSRRDFVSAAEWFRKGSERAGAPWWLKSLAANTLARGGDRETSRLLYMALAENAENDWIRRDALRRLRQLDAADMRDALRLRVQRFKESGGQPPYTWPRLIEARLLRSVPMDPDGFPFQIGPYTGDVDVSDGSPLFPLPDEPSAAQTRRPPA